MCQIGDWQQSTHVSERQGLAGWRWFVVETYKGHRGEKARLTALYDHDHTGRNYRYRRGVNRTLLSPGNQAEGFWSYKTIGLARLRVMYDYRVLARVTVSGQVERHAKGYRSSALKIEELYLSSKPDGAERSEWERRIKLAAKNYKVKVVKPQSKPVFA